MIIITSEIIEYNCDVYCAQATDQELENALEMALQVGYRHIDTAAVYFNEHVIGKVLNKWISSGKLKRDDLYVTTKVINIFVSRVTQSKNRLASCIAAKIVDNIFVENLTATVPRQPSQFGRAAFEKIVESFAPRLRRPLFNTRAVRVQRRRRIFSKRRGR